MNLKYFRSSVLVVTQALAMAFCLVACEEKPPEEPEQKPVPPVEKPKEAAKEMPPPAPAMPPPADACAALITAVKAKDEAKMLSMSTDTTAGALGAEGAKDHLMAALAPATCGAAKVEGDNATVAITGGEAAQELSFFKSKEGWKFDGAAYLVKYPPAPDSGKHAKGKAAKMKGAKGKHKKK